MPLCWHCLVLCLVVVMLPRNSTQTSRKGCANVPAETSATLRLDEQGVVTSIKVGSLPTRAGRQLMTLVQNRIWRNEAGGLLTVSQCLINDECLLLLNRYMRLCIT